MVIKTVGELKRFLKDIPDDKKLLHISYSNGNRRNKYSVPDIFQNVEGSVSLGAEFVGNYYKEMEK